jgi:hypothetical protein
MCAYINKKNMLKISNVCALKTVFFCTEKKGHLYTKTRSRYVQITKIVKLRTEKNALNILYRIVVREEKPFGIYTYTYMYMYTYMHVHVCVCVYIYIYIYSYIHTYIHIISVHNRMSWMAGAQNTQICVTTRKIVSAIFARKNWRGKMALTMEA